ncbi:MAG: thioredoxin peroxidase [Candidatus Sungbacteria bacterium RIFCSPHIGHO2_02_FULL_49_20]|uniref:Thioredoxin peroxidase n=1 Tax=Candidatus Sungbacteria bacterium RIFCSPHIGHO2_02_FULL_49_20 TaxID=1802272 RepID=A0A1G2KRU3_9BACT|nr:MAG: thioredoxin peroxidase [Candidatus Sungbacteria bacterium RIFCSPHIGHO2_02_FULL_49_20]
MLKIGQPVPEFTLQGILNGKVSNYSLAKQKNKWTVIFFYPLDFTFVCPTEIRGFNKHFEEFKKLKADIWGVSVDSVHSHRAWIEQDFKSLKFPLLSDFNKEVTREYEVDTEAEEGTVALRGTFIVDPEGKLRHVAVSDNDVGRSVEETLRIVQALQTGKLCPVEWEPGEKTLN